MQPQEITQQSYQFFYNAENPDTLVALKNLQLMGHLTRSNGTVFSNIIILPDPLVANIYKLSLRAMINQPVASEVMIKRFCQLARTCYPNQLMNIKEFQNSVLSQLGGAEESHLLLEYTKETFYHKLLNNLLRVGRDSLQTFYAHYFVQKMHKAILRKYRSQFKNKKQFTCYRGCRLKEAEIRMFKQNKGRYIQTLGFLSTSRNEMIALQFASNAIFEILVTDEPKETEFDQGFIEINDFQNEVLFNILCSFEIIQISTVNYNNLQILKVKLKYGQLGHLMSKYYNRKNTVYSDMEKDIIMSVTHQQFSIADMQGQILPSKSTIKFNYYEKLLGLIQNCSSYNNLRKLIHQSKLINLTHFQTHSPVVEKIISKSISVQNDELGLHDIVREMLKFDKMNNEVLQNQQFKHKIIIIIKKIQKIKPSMLLMKKGIEKGKTIKLLEKQLKFQILILRSCIDFKMLSKKYSDQQLINDIQQLKIRVRFIFGQFHPLYYEIFKTECDYQKTRPLLLQSPNKLKQFFIRKGKSSPQNFTMEYFIARKLQTQAILTNPKNWQCQLSNLKYNQKVEAYQNYNSNTKMKIHNQLSQILYRQMNSLFEQSKLNECEKLIKSMQKNMYYQHYDFDETLNRLQIHQKNAQFMYTNSLSSLINSWQYQNDIFKECLANNLTIKLKNIENNFGKDSEIYVAHCCFEVFNLKILGRYEEAQLKYDIILNQISGSQKQQELMLFILNQADDED